MYRAIGLAALRREVADRKPARARVRRRARAGRVRLGKESARRAAERRAGRAPPPRHGGDRGGEIRRARCRPSATSSSKSGAASAASTGDLLTEGRDQGSVVFPGRRVQVLPDGHAGGAGATAGPRAARPRRDRRREGDPAADHGPRRPRPQPLRSGRWRSRTARTSSIPRD